MKNIIIAVDFVEDNEILLEKSIEIIKKFQAKIWIIHIAAPEPDFVGYAGNSKSERKYIADKLVLILRHCLSLVQLLMRW